MKKYQPKNIESKWQEKWDKDNLYASNLSAPKKYYVLAEFAYPSGDVHMGHWFTWAGADVYARFKRMQGYNVFFPNGSDAFGLPAENAAIKRNIHPQDWTMSNITRMKQQFATLGGSFTFDHEVITCLPNYYHWNQWIFLKMFERGLAYRGTYLSNWCSICQTVLANEGVVDGACWRCDSPVEQKEVPQWFFKITDYAEELLWPEKPSVDWPKSVRDAQNSWIGKSEGVNFRYKVKDTDIHFEMFDSVPQTFMAQTFTVIAPEHPMVYELVKGTKYESEVMDFADKVRSKRATNRFDVDKEVEGVFTGRYLEYSPTGKSIPIWVASFAVYEYGTGVVNCSVHDERDFAFAKKYGLPLHPVMFPKDPALAGQVRNLEVCYHHAPEGILEEPKEFKGRRWAEVREDIIKFIEEKGYGKRKVQYHLHDWSISRQRYWGTPIPMIHCPGCGIVPVPEKDLPIELPYDVDYTPKGKPPLASNEKWMSVKCPKCGGDAKRDPETMDTFVDSSWYFFRYISPNYPNGPVDPDLVDKIMPVDIYFGGAEHTLGHTLYSRFVTKFFHDLEITKYDEYALKRVNHGIVLGPDGRKMSKSKGNVVNPDDEVKRYGTDAVRAYVLFFMPYDGTGPWVSDSIWGTYRFLERIWNLSDKVKESKLSEEDRVFLNRTIKKVTKDIESIKFNTAIASLMEWSNYLSKKQQISKEEFKTFLLLLAPIAPFITEELWSVLGEGYSIHQQSWPKFDSKQLEGSKATIVIQVNGKVRDEVQIGSDIVSKQPDIEKLALERPKIQKFLTGRVVKKSIYIPGKVINFVIS